MRTSPDLIARAMRVPRAAQPAAVGPGGDKTGPEEIDRDTFIASLAARRDAAAGGLAQLKKLRQKGLDPAIEAALAALQQRVTGKPELVPGIVIVRVVGVRRDGDAARRVPLAGMTVRLGNEKEGIETQTDPVGIAALDPQTVAKRTDEQPPRTGGEPGELQLLAPDRTVIHRRKLTPKDLKGVADVIDVAEAPPLAAAFAAGEIWLKALEAAAKRAKQANDLADKVLPRLEEELGTIKDGLARALADASKTMDTKSIDPKPPGTKPPGTTPPGTKPPDTKLPDTKPPGTKPPDTKLPDTKPPGTKSTGTKSTGGPGRPRRTKR